MWTLALMASLIICCLHGPFWSHSSSRSLPLLLEIAHKLSSWKCHQRQLMTKLRLQEAISELAKESLVNSKVLTKYERTEAICCNCKTVFLVVLVGLNVPGKREHGKFELIFRCQVKYDRTRGRKMLQQVVDDKVNTVVCVCLKDLLVPRVEKLLAVLSQSVWSITSWRHISVTAPSLNAAAGLWLW